MNRSISSPNAAVVAKQMGWQSARAGYCVPDWNDATDEDLSQDLVVWAGRQVVFCDIKSRLDCYVWKADEH